MRSEDISGLFTGDTQDVKFHQGVLTAWDPQTGANTAAVNGGILTDVPTLNLTEAAVLQAGMVITLLSWRSSYWIAGRVVAPGSLDFFSGVMPAVSTAFYDVNSGPHQQTNTNDSNYYPKHVSTHVIHHRRVIFGARFNRTVPASGNFRVRWYASYPGNGANPAGGTDLHVSATNPAASPAGSPGGWISGLEYTWPGGMRGQQVVVTYEARMTGGTTGVDWVAALPSYFIGTD